MNVAMHGNILTQNRVAPKRKFVFYQLVEKRDKKRRVTVFFRFRTSDVMNVVILFHFYCCIHSVFQQNNKNDKNCAGNVLCEQ